MTKYLLSDGTVTSDKSKELIDRLVTRLKLYGNSIPRSSNNGIPKTISGIDNTVLMDQLSINIGSIAKSISSQINIVSISMKSGSYYIKIKINSVEYDVTISN